MVSLEFFIDINFLLQYAPGVDTASNRNDYQEYFLGCGGGEGKGRQCVDLTALPTSCADFHEIGSLNLLEPSGNFQAYTGIAVTLPY